MKKITALIQARLGSTRLPRKTLMMLEGETLLWHLIKRVRASKYVNDFVIATTTQERDNEIVGFTEKNNLNTYRGSENDVLDRFYKAAVRYKVETIVRVTPDCPMLDPIVMDKVISKYLESGYDYVSNTLPPTFPDGLDTEVFSFAALETAWDEAKLSAEREHVTPYITANPELFRLCNVENEENLSHLRWTVDTQRDFEFVKKVFLNFKGKDIFFMEDVLELLRKKPYLLEINKGIIRNEGYLKSLRRDGILNS